MDTEKYKRSRDKDRIRQNLLNWAEVTALCVELRKSVLQIQSGIDDEEELIRMVFAEAVARKEKQWESMKH